MRSVRIAVLGALVVSSGVVGCRNRVADERDALSEAAGILRDHLDIFIHPEELGEAKPDGRRDEERREVNRNLFRSVNELEV